MRAYMVTDAHAHRPLQDERGVSRDEMAAVVTEVAEGRIPKDRIALKCLFDEMKEWPFMDTSVELPTGAGQAAPAAAAAPSASDYAALMGEGEGGAQTCTTAKQRVMRMQPAFIARHLAPGWPPHGPPARL